MRLATWAHLAQVDASAPPTRMAALGQHAWRPQRQVGDIEDADPVGLAENDAGQRQGVVVSRLVGVVLDADQVEAERVQGASEFQGSSRVVGRRVEEAVKLEVVAIVGDGIAPDETVPSASRRAPSRDG